MHGTTDSRPPLTWREEKVFKALHKSVREDGSFPTMRAIAEMIGIKSHSGVQIAMDRLVAKGYIFHRGGRAHSNTHNGRLYSLTPIVEPPPLEVIVHLNYEGRFVSYAASPKIKVIIRRAP